jgi:hypothetical protein
MNKNDDPVWVTVLRVSAFAIFSFALIGWGYIFEQPCNGIDNSTLWCALHPVKWWNIIGVLFVEVAMALIIGVYSLVLGVFYADKGEYNGYVGLTIGLALAGGILMFV